MPGRPKMMLKRVETIYKNLTELVDYLLDIEPEQFRKQEAILPEWLEELEQSATAPLSKRIELNWRVCIGHAVRFESLLEQLTILLAEKAAISRPPLMIVRDENGEPIVGEEPKGNDGESCHSKEMQPSKESAASVDREPA